MPTNVSIQNRLIESLMPVAAEKIKAEQSARIDEIVKIVEAEKESDEFFASPSRYFAKRGMLSLPTVPLPNGREMPVLDDASVAKFVLDLRAKVKAGGKIDLDVLRQSYTLVRDEAVYDTKTMWTRRDYWTETKKDSSIDIRDIIDFGPLVSGSVMRDLQKRMQQSARRK